MADDFEDGDQFLRSRMPADNNYGQNGYLGSSSTRPGENVSSNFLPEAVADAAALRAENFQTREVSAQPYPAAHGQKPRGYLDIGKPVRAVKAAGPTTALKRSN